VTTGWPAVIVTATAAFLFARVLKKKKWDEIEPESMIFLFVALIIPLGAASILAARILLNIVLLAVGLFTIRIGAKINHLGVLNYGLLIVTAQIIARFFDYDMTYVLRGLLFMSIGVAFFGANYLLIRKANRTS